LNKLTSFSFNDIELECEFDPHPQPCDLFPIFESKFTLVSLPNLHQFSEPTFIPVPIDLEIESPILDSHISLVGKECEIKFFDLDSTLEAKLTLEPKVDFPELVLVPELFISEPKLSISQNHTYC